MDTRATRTRLSVLPVFIALLFNVLLASPLAPIAPDGALALTGSSFDATDGNMVVDGAELDWCSPGLPIASRTDTPTGSSDNSFKASADPDPVPTIENGSIPNNKVDYDRVYATSEINPVTGDLFAYVSFIRNDTTGTGTLSFELNQSGVLTSNGVTFERTQGDLLIEFNFQKSTDNWVVNLSYRVWNGDATDGEWSDAIALGVPLAEGSVNAVDIVDCLNGNNPLVDGQFGEFAINLTDLLGGQCRSFGSILAKSRSSNQVTSNLNDLVLPIPVDFSTCATITWQKDDQYGDPVAGATFRVTPNPFLANHTGSLDVLDNFGQGGYAGADSDPIGGQFRLENVEPFTTPGYTICEWLAPSSQYVVNQTDCVTLPVGASANVDFGTFINTLLEPDVIVSKAGPTEPIVAGDAYEYVLTATNQGTFAAENVTVTDDLDDTLTINSLTPSQGSCAAAPYVGNAISCNLGTLAANGGFATVKVNVTPSVESCPEVVNQSNVSASNEPARHTGNNSSEEVTVEILCPNPSVLKQAVATPVSAGDSAAFNITVSGGGSGSATDVTLSDTVPANHTWTVTGADAGDCIDPNPADVGLVLTGGQTLTCNFGTLASDDPPKLITITSTSTAADCANGITNTATITATGDSDTSPESNSSTAHIDVLCPDLEVVKEQVDANGEPTDEPVDAGTTAYFEIHVTNHGPGTALDVDVLDFAPGGTVWTVVDNGGFTCPDTIDDEGDSCTVEVMQVGTSTILLSYLTTEADCPSLENNVEVSASNELPAKVGPDNESSADIVVECPGLNLTKSADADPILAGDEASFTITVWNTGPGDALGVTLDDDFPAGLSWDFEVLSAGAASETECGLASSVVLGSEPQMSLHCELGTVGVTDMADGTVIRVFATTDRTDCGELVNTAIVDATNSPEPPPAPATIVVSCPEIALEKVNDAVGSVLPGTTVTYTLTLKVNDESLENGEATAVTVYDVIPVGLEDPTNFDDGGIGGSVAYDATTRTVTWVLGDLGEGTYELTYEATVADGVANGAALVNAAEATSTNTPCPDRETNGPECEDDSTVIVRVPTLVIDKVASTELITITGPNDALVATPSVVTWTLTYTLTSGPVTNAVITDEVPVGFEFLDASNGGTESGGVVTWILDSPLEASGSVTFRTTVDPETISRVAPTVNVAFIISDETPEDDGEDSVRVTREEELGGNPPPSLPNTAAGIGLNGEPITVPIELLAAFFIGSLGALALANVKARNRRR